MPYYKDYLRSYIPSTISDDALLRNARLYKYNFYSELPDLIKNYDMLVVKKERKKEDPKKKEEPKEKEEPKVVKPVIVKAEVKNPAVPKLPPPAPPVQKPVVVKPPRIILAKLEDRDAYVFISVNADTNVAIFQQLVLKETDAVKNEKFMTTVDDLSVVYNQVYQEMRWNKDGYEIMYPYGK